ncbi:WD repeat-containing protein 44-like [Iris pallida]|uniref:WD repeat-containing protein 44-like n=1 Tax=Iris pallida TaxID=29817 RepID=A0AAX6G1Z4_IRIPA|nr:WD repeat-containing protein 44-like [Iris pallida]
MMDSSSGGEEFFYESLDRIISSSCSSTSVSDEEPTERCYSSGRAAAAPAASSASFDVWIREPSSVEERRRRMLHQMGLAGDPSLSRQNPPPPSPIPTGRSASCNGFPPASSAGGGAVVRSRSDSGSVDRTGHPHHRSLGVPAPPKPPITSRRSSDAAVVGIGSLDGGDGLDEDEIMRRRRTIRSLDTGKEFEVEEDGSWNKEVRELGTGRHLSMDEFEITVGRSPIVQELMRRQNVENAAAAASSAVAATGGARPKKRGGWIKSIKSAAGIKHRNRCSGDEKDAVMEKGGRRSSSATDDSPDGGHHGLERTRVHQCGKLNKELTGLFMSQEIKAHNGSIWSIKFSLDGKYLASAGEDCVIHVWQVNECETKGDLVTERDEKRSSDAMDPMLALACVEGNHWEKKRRAKVTGRKSRSSVDQLMVPEHVFALSDKPICSFRGHLDDVLDLSWSKSQYLLSSSMDKTVRLWHLSSNSCLKTFSHSDYVTCIQFNPVDDDYFISGSLDEKVRIWSIPDRQVVDWHDLHEMVTAACYTPNGQGALVGSHKGNCHLYNTSDNKLLLESQIDLQNKKKKSSHRKITGFQFAPGSSSEVLVTSADSRIRVIEDTELVHKFKGFRNTSSQISASLTTNGKYLICASEDSRVYVWRYDVSKSRSSRSKGFVTVMQSYEHFQCPELTVAIPWPASDLGGFPRSNSSKLNRVNGISKTIPAVPADHSLFQSRGCNGGNAQQGVLSTSATWPEEKLLATMKYNSKRTGGSCNGGLQVQSWPAWGMVIVTAGKGGQIKTFQNFGFEVLI